MSDKRRFLGVHDEGFERELLGLAAPLAFIDFETFSAKPSPIPGTRPDDNIPCQWSCHILQRPGLQWQGNLSHAEFLWTGDWGFNPIYAFVESLYEATSQARTLLIYSNYEITCLNLCKQLAENDINAYRQGKIDDNYVVVNANGHKVPLMDIAPKIAGWCSSMIERMYDMLYGYNRRGGVAYFLQSPDLHNSNSIKAVLPAAMDEYSQTAALLAAYNIPSNGYEGLAAQGAIAKGDQCTRQYAVALDRPQRAGVALNVDGAAPFPENIKQQCLRYCCLDTLSMVILYFAVLEATQRWHEASDKVAGQYAWFPAEKTYHAAYMDGDAHGLRKVCHPDEVYDPHNVFLVSQAYLDNMNIRDFYTSVCPQCRKDWNSPS